MNHKTEFLKVGQAYQVKGFKQACPLSYMHRLLAFGFIPGATFLIRRVAPLGNPYEIEVQGVKVSLRKSELEFLQLVVVS
ncbi:FeoA domain-containing protein [Thiotrichales bacterium 19S11-10]|nr:FeoA domain-containing protein [Thiotrichales bacterium 19S11-10]